jgi:tRNA(Ile)-lysidine synthase
MAENETLTRDAFVEKVSARMHQIGCLPGGGRIGVAFSGGADSLSLLVALADGGYDAVALHCNFHLRGAESDGDTAFCRDMCANLGVELRVVDFDTEALRLGGESIEMACRRLRYEWFEKMARELHLRAVATAHHSEDLAETVMLNLFRGTGVEGLRGIPTSRDIYIRPMLGLTRSEVEEYLARRGLSFRTDSTNALDCYRRNAIRNTLLPEAERLCPGAMHGILTSASNVAATSTLLNDLLRRMVKEVMIEEGIIDMDRVRAIEADTSTLLFHLLRVCFPPGVNNTVAADIAAATGSGLMFDMVDGRRLELSYDRLMQVDESEPIDIAIDLLAPTLPHGLKLTEISYEQFRKEKRGASTIYLHKSVIDGVPNMRLRTVARGDRMRPFGMKGTRLVSDILAERKSTLSERRKALVLTRNDEVLWVVGVRASAAFAVVDDGTQILRLSVDR